MGRRGGKRKRRKKKEEEKERGEEELTKEEMQLREHVTMDALQNAELVASDNKTWESDWPKTRCVSGSFVIQ